MNDELPIMRFIGLCLRRIRHFVPLPNGWFWSFDYCDGPVIPIYWLGLFYIADDGEGWQPRRWCFGWNKD